MWLPVTFSHGSHVCPQRWHRIWLNHHFLSSECSVVSDSLWPPSTATLLCLWDFPGKNDNKVVIPFSRGPTQPRDGTRVSWVSFTGRWILYHGATRDPPQGNLKTRPWWRWSCNSQAAISGRSCPQAVNHVPLVGGDGKRDWIPEKSYTWPTRTGKSTGRCKSKPQWDMTPHPLGRKWKC